MNTRPDAEPPMQDTVARRIKELQKNKQVVRAIELLRQREEVTTTLQIHFAEIPTVDYKASRRAQYLARLFEEIGLSEIRQDEEGNVIGVLPGTARKEPVVLLSAHLDTVFPGLEDLRVERDGDILRGPGVSDDAAGLAAVVHLMRAIRDAGLQLRRDLVAVGTVGEEGEGDLRGVKHLFKKQYPPERVAAFLTLDIGSPIQVANEGLGSRRLHVTVRGPGGHSWGDFGQPNPIHALARGIASFMETKLPTGARTSFNIGLIEGGRGVNVIPEDASLSVDLRSETSANLIALEKTFRTALQKGLAAEKAWSREPEGLTIEIEVIGDRPVGKTPVESRLVRTIVAAFATQELEIILGSSSTDANLPMSLGVPALGLPHGAIAQGAHSLSESCDLQSRHAVLSAEILALVALCELERPQKGTSRRAQ